jgi:hypothetical protein
MLRLTITAILIVTVTGSKALSQSAGFLSLPASAFTPRQVKGNAGGYDGNETGTARSFTNSTFSMLAPVHLPHGATVTSLSCGGRDPAANLLLKFTLRRNEPQQANVDMAVVSTTFEQIGFQFLNTTSIVQPLVNNQRFTYYIVAETRHIDVGFCPTCAVGFCKVGFTTPNGAGSDN